MNTLHLAGDARGEAPEAPPGDVACITLHGLTRRFGDLTAVDALSFDVRRGELFGIVGPDGAGKTTTLRMLAGVLPPSEGDATVLGVSVARDPERVKPHLAYMAQRFGLYEDLSVRENIEFYADLYRVPKRERPARLERLYRFSNLGEFQDRLAGALSGGMKQKLSLSCALIHRPELLLLDEPTFGVDPISRRDLWLILHEMVAEGVTVVVTTSYLDEAERCDRVALLDKGRVLALGTPGELQASLAGRLFEVRVAGDLRVARDALRAVPGVGRAALFGDAVHVVAAPGAPPRERERESVREEAGGRGGRVGAGDRDSRGRDRKRERVGDRERIVGAGDREGVMAEIRGALEAAGCAAVSVEAVAPSLEDVFLDRVGTAPNAPPATSVAGGDAVSPTHAGPSPSPARGGDDG